MNAEWTRTSLGKLKEQGLASIQTGPFGTVLKAAEYAAVGVPVVSVGEIRYGHIEIHERTPRVDAGTTCRLPQFLLEEGDIVFGRKGGIDRNALISHDEAGWFLGSDGIRLRLASDIDSTFVSYQFRSPSVGKWLLGNSAGSIMPSLNEDVLRRLPLWLPELEEQQKIGAALSTLDAKIDLNNRINAELEALATTIYDYWFVQFDFPDADGRPYKSSGGKMVWSEGLKREIPAGWEAVPLSRLVEEVKDGVAPNASDNTTPYVGLEHIARRSIVISSWAAADKATSNKIAFRKGDILFGKIRPYFHKVALAMMDGITSTDAIVMRPKQQDFAALTLETIFSDRFVEAATASSTGSKMPRADWNVMRNYTIAVPDKASAVASAYQQSFERIRGRIENNVQQNRELTRLRDWLLPLLMNGQVRVA